MTTVLQALWFLLPAGAANMAPVFGQRLLPGLVTPVDFGRTFGGKRIFGDHKTWRGLLLGSLAGGLMFALQTLFTRFAPAIAEGHLEVFNQAPWWFGFWQGCWALLGDLSKSFFKRRLAIRPGTSWLPFDQVDWILGAVFGSILLIDLPFRIALIATILGSLLSLSFHVLGYWLRINADPI